MDRDETSELLSAYLDGELSEKDRAVVERLLAEDASARQLCAELQQTSQAMSALPQRAAPASIMEAFQRGAEREMLLDGPVDSERREPRRILRFGRLLSLAAVIGFLAVTSVWFLQDLIVPAPGEKNSAIQPMRSERVASAPRANDSSNRAASGLRSVKRKRALPTPQKDAGVSTKGERLASAAKRTPDRARFAGKAESKSDLDSMASSESKLQEPIIRDRLLALASADQKLDAGLAFDSLLGHSFDNEPIRLQLVAKKSTGHTVISRQIESRFRVQKIADLAEAKPIRRRDAAQGFFYEGKKGVNFSADHEKQILVRIPARKLGQFIDAIPLDEFDAGDVKLKHGPMVFRGTSAVTYALRRLGDKEGEAPMAPLTGHDSKNLQDRNADRGGHTADDSRTVDGQNDGTGMIAGLLDVIGMTSRMLESQVPSKEAPKEAEQVLADTESQAGGVTRKDAGPRVTSNAPMSVEPSTTPGTKVPAAKLSPALAQSDDSPIRESSDSVQSLGKVDASAKESKQAQRADPTLTLVERRQREVEERVFKRSSAKTVDQDMRMESVIADKRPVPGNTRIGLAEEASNDYITLVICVAMPPTEDTRDSSKPSTKPASPGDPPVKPISGQDTAKKFQ